jgi:glycopeptide antibiotics resistance protein
MDNWGIVILELLYTYIYIHKHVYHIMFPVFTMATHEWTLAENQLCFFLNCKLYLKSVRKGKLLMDNDGE